MVVPNTMLYLVQGRNSAGRDFVRVPERDRQEAGAGMLGDGKVRRGICGRLAGGI